MVPTTRGHCEGELWGVAVSPDAKHFVSCGEDNRVFKWQLGTQKCIGSAIIAEKRGAMPKILRASTMSTLPPNQCARAIAISPNGTDVAIGCNDGFVHVYDFASMTKKHSIDLNPHGKRMVTNQKGNWIQVAKYSPSGDLLAVGTHGSVICLLDPKRGYAVRGVLDKHNSFITHIDWSLDGQFMQSNDGAYELLFWSVDEKDPSASRQHTNVSGLRDTQWATQTCILGWSVQGIFDPTQDGTDVNTVDTAPSKRFIVTGDDYGDLNLFRYPCAAEGNAKKSFIGHSSHVVTARFTPDERHVISSGGNDKALFVWRITSS
jgi:WD40 repeat protein